MQVIVEGKEVICLLSQLVLEKRNLASMVEDEKLLKLGIVIVTVIELVSASCFEMVRFPGTGKDGATEIGICVVKILWVDPIALVALTKQPRILPAILIKRSLLTNRRSEVDIGAPINPLPFASVIPQLFCTDSIFEVDVCEPSQTM